MAKKQLASLVQKLGHNMFSTLAVVGSSGSLKYASHGEEIDANDVVVRINGAPSADTGWAADIQAIGNRTDMAFVTDRGIVVFASPGGHAPKPTAVVFWVPPDICASDEVRRAHGDYAQSVVSADGMASGVWTCHHLHHPLGLKSQFGTSGPGRGGLGGIHPCSLVFVFHVSLRSSP